MSCSQAASGVFAPLPPTSTDNLADPIVLVSSVAW